MAEIKKKKKKKKNIVTHGCAHIKSTFNNTHITLSDKSGNVLIWEKAGTSGFKGSRKKHCLCGYNCREKAAQAALALGLSSVDVEVKGPGSGRESAIRALAVGRSPNYKHKRCDTTTA